MCNKFLKRGYPPRVIQDFKQKALGIERNTLFIKKVRKRDERIPFVSTYGVDSGRIANTLRKHWGILQKGCPNIVDFQRPPLMS